MGVPKFYRWISERYPNISLVINDNQIPDFDNFYLDMNGIIHACSHLNDDHSEIIVTEEEIFRNIFHYIDFLFRMIKPKKVFYMAVDGVAPRAKMNQQRSRRFRAGKERTRKLKNLAEKNGQTLEETAAKHFDTNCITPGTPFMANLHEQLKYFIHVKLTTDPLWENVDVHLSGHLTPGEGEHKIMEYIRYTRSQPGYNVNTRHCLYGLDADLMMLGLVTHEMHFALLREEVKYGSKKISKILAPEEINWHLLHTCLLRDYIDLEFRSLKDKLQFPYNLDRIVDDWILMGYLVGNDFIPHLPHFHINEEALSILWDTYKKVLPTLDGYMNESGELNLTRFETYLTELSKFDHERYAADNDSFKHLDKLNHQKKSASKAKPQAANADFDFAVLDKLDTQPTVTSENTEPIIPTEGKSSDLSSASEDNDLSSDSSTLTGESDNDDDLTDDESKKITSSSTATTTTIHQDDIDKLPLIEAEFRQHKNHYYRNKMKIDLVSTDQLQKYVNEYIEALQWILKYYYQGCPSWSWFYPQHYAPYLSDLKNFKHLNIILNKGQPFKPFEQLLSVLPPTSRQLLPTVLQPLMTDSSSPLLHFYPEDFELDINEKKQDWESIVLLPFIEEELLLNTITKYYNQLNSSEQIRNQFLPSLCFRTTSNLHPIGNSLEPNPYFPPIKETRAAYEEFPIDYYQIDQQDIKYGRFQDQNVFIYPKFPVLNVLPYKYAYKTNAVSLFEQRSKSVTLVLNLINQPDSDCITYNQQWNPKEENSSPPYQIKNIHPLIERYLGKCVFVNWPHVKYGIVCAISDFRHVYTWTNMPGQPCFYSEPVNLDENQNRRNYIQTPIYVSYSPFEVVNDKKKAIYATCNLNEMETQMEYTKAININRYYESRQGVSIGPIPILLYVSPLIGYRIKCDSTTDQCRTTMCFSDQALAYPLQTTLFKIPNYKSNDEQIPKTLNEYFKINEPIFGLQAPYYSSLGYVQEVTKDNKGKYSIVCRMESADLVNQPDIHSLTPKLEQHQLKYFTAQNLADQLKTIPCVIAKLTGKINVLTGKRRKRVFPTNIGLSWKFNKPVKELYGYTKKINDVWCYSEQAIPIIAEYMSKFPEIIAELQRRPQDDNYYETNIWPDKNGKHELQQVRMWIKSLPTYTISLTDSAWQVLDTLVIKEIAQSVKSYYEKQAAKNPNKKIKTVSLDPAVLYKSNEYFGMSDPDIQTVFYLFDRVITVRPGTGVPVGTRGTVVGIMHRRTNLDTYYEILFDNLPPNCLEGILLGKSQEKCRIKVRSYHLLNYTHALRLRSTNYQTQRSAPSVNQHSSGQIPRYQQQQQRRNSKTESNTNNTSTLPKSAPPLPTNQRPYFVKDNEQKSNTSVLTENLSNVPITTAPTNMTTLSTETPSNALFFHAIQDSNQIKNQPQQIPGSNASASFQSSDQGMYDPRTWGTQLPPQYFQTPSMRMPIQVSSSGIPPPFPHNIQPYNLMSPIGYDGVNGPSSFPPYGVQIPGSPIQTMTTSIPMNYEQRPQAGQQLPISTAIPNLSMEASQLAQNSTLSYDAPVFEPRQTVSSSTNQQTVQFDPSQVSHNIPKNNQSN